MYIIKRDRKTPKYTYCCATLKLCMALYLTRQDEKPQTIRWILVAVFHSEIKKRNFLFEISDFFISCYWHGIYSLVSFVFGGFLLDDFALYRSDFYSIFCCYMYARVKTKGWLGACIYFNHALLCLTLYKVFSL